MRGAATPPACARILTCTFTPHPPPTHTPLLPQVKILLDTFLKDIAVSADNFGQGAPYSHEHTTTEQAFASLDVSKAVRAAGLLILAWVAVEGVPA